MLFIGLHNLMDLCTFQRYKASRVSKCEKGDFSIELIDSLVIDAFQDPSKRLQKEAMSFSDLE
jgi:hypothetical protein